MLSLDVSGSTDIPNRKKLANFPVLIRMKYTSFPLPALTRMQFICRATVLRQGRYSYKPGMKLTDLVLPMRLLPERLRNTPKSSG